MGFNLSRELRFAKSLYRDLLPGAWKSVRRLLEETQLSIEMGEVVYVNGAWYVRHAGLLRLAKQHRCAGIHAQPILSSCEPSRNRWVFTAKVYKSAKCRGFAGYGDADPSNISPLLLGAEMRIAETRAVNRALRKAYGIGICSVEEIGSFSAPPSHNEHGVKKEIKKVSSQPTNGNSYNGNGSRVRDRLCQIIRQHNLDAELVKSYAVDFCGTKSLREASREQVENFVVHLADWAAKDRNALLCQLNSYSRPQAGAA